MIYFFCLQFAKFLRDEFLIFVCVFYFHLFMLMGFSILCVGFLHLHKRSRFSFLFFSFWFWLFICFLLGDTDLFPFLLCYRLL
jgi:hypothetical protein